MNGLLGMRTLSNVSLCCCKRLDSIVLVENYVDDEQQVRFSRWTIDFFSLFNPLFFKTEFLENWTHRVTLNYFFLWYKIVTLLKMWGFLCDACMLIFLIYDHHGVLWNFRKERRKFGLLMATSISSVSSFCEDFF